MSNKTLYVVIALVAAGVVYWYWKKHGKKLPTAPGATVKRQTRSQVGGFHKGPQSGIAGRNAMVPDAGRIHSAEIGRSTV